MRCALAAAPGRSYAAALGLSAVHNFWWRLSALLVSSFFPLSFTAQASLWKQRIRRAMDNDDHDHENLRALLAKMQGELDDMDAKNAALKRELTCKRQYDDMDEDADADEDADEDEYDDEPLRACINDAIEKQPSTLTPFWIVLFVGLQFFFYASAAVVVGEDIAMAATAIATAWPLRPDFSLSHATIHALQKDEDNSVYVRCCTPSHADRDLIMIGRRCFGDCFLQSWWCSTPTDALLKIVRRLCNANIYPDKAPTIFVWQVDNLQNACGFRHFAKTSYTGIARTKVVTSSGAIFDGVRLFVFDRITQKVDLFAAGSIPPAGALLA
jgi:hypothetical protein